LRDTLKIIVPLRKKRRGLQKKHFKKHKEKIFSSNDIFLKNVGN
jgi:hypothetical protein